MFDFTFPSDVCLCRELCWSLDRTGILNGLWFCERKTGDSATATDYYWLTANHIFFCCHCSCIRYSHTTNTKIISVTKLHICLVFPLGDPLELTIWPVVWWFIYLGLLKTHLFVGGGLFSLRFPRLFRSAPRWLESGLCSLVGGNRWNHQLT